MKSILLFLLFATLLSPHVSAHAEGNCPPGFYPTTPPGQSGPQGCAPIPGNSLDSNTSQGPHWVSRWGAIATDVKAGSVGASIDMQSQRKAEKAAINDCKSKGGTRCVIQISYANGCAAMIVGDSIYNTTSDAMADVAIKAGLKNAVLRTPIAMSITRIAVRQRKFDRSTPWRVPMKLNALLLPGLMVLSQVVSAEGSCPPGYYPTTPQGQQGPQGCAPIPNYNQGSDSDQLSSGPRWVSRWGAIATDSKVGSLGASVGMQSQRKAEKQALADCKEKGGAKCVIEVSYANGSGAMVVGHTGHSSAYGATVDDAIQSATKICSSDGDENCHVYYANCSPPAQMR